MGNLEVHQNLLESRVATIEKPAEDTNQFIGHPVSIPNDLIFSLFHNFAVAVEIRFGGELPPNPRHGY